MNNDTFRILDEEHLLIFASANINTPISATQRYISLRSLVLCFSPLGIPKYARFIFIYFALKMYNGNADLTPQRIYVDIGCCDHRQTFVL